MTTSRDDIIKLARECGFYQPHVITVPPILLYTTPPDHTAVLQQALEALKSCTVEELATTFYYDMGKVHYAIAEIEGVLK